MEYVKFTEHESPNSDVYIRKDMIVTVYDNSAYVPNTTIIFTVNGDYLVEGDVESVLKKL